MPRIGCSRANCSGPRFFASGDKILSENYFQHADHFTRILNDQDAQRKLNSINNDISKSQESIVEVNKEQKNIDEKKTVTQIK